MSDLFWLTDEQIERLRPFFPKSHGRSRVDAQRVLAASCSSTATDYAGEMRPVAVGPRRALYNRWKRWGERGVFTRMMEGLAAGDAEQKTVMIDATYLKAHRTASSLRVKVGISAACSVWPKAA